MALFLSMCLSILFLSLYGDGYPRYILTNFPAVITVIFLFGYDTLKRENYKIRALVIVSICFLMAGNIYTLADTYKYYWNAGIGMGKSGERFPYKLFHYLDENIEDNNQIGVKNLPFFFYHFNKKTENKSDRAGKYILLRGDSLSDHELVIEDQGYKLYKKERSNKNKIVSTLLQGDLIFETDFFQ